MLFKNLKKKRRKPKAINFYKYAFIYVKGDRDSILVQRFALKLENWYLYAIKKKCILFKYSFHFFLQKQPSEKK